MKTVTSKQWSYIRALTERQCWSALKDLPFLEYPQRHASPTTYLALQTNFFGQTPLSQTANQLQTV